MKPLCWITGAAGLIGHQLLSSAPTLAPHLTPRPLTRQDVDLTRFDAVTRLFLQESPGIIIHCAAMSRSPACQDNPAAAQLANTQVTRHLAQLARDIPLYFFSTDLVFDGQQGHYTEAHPTRPLLVYGQTKHDAEHSVRSNPNHTIIRTSLNAGTSPSGKSSFSENLILAWKSGQTPKLFTDEFRTPIDASVTARATWELVRQQATGTYHLAGSERLSRFEIGQVIAATQTHLHCPIQPASIHDFAGSPRPADTSLNCSKIQKLLSFPLPSFRQWQP